MVAAQTTIVPLTIATPIGNEKAAVQSAFLSLGLQQSGTQERQVGFDESVVAWCRNQTCFIGCLDPPATTAGVAPPSLRIVGNLSLIHI